jgi:hypothetical protein
MNITRSEKKEIYNKNFYLIDEDDNAYLFMCDLYERSKRLKKIKKDEYQDYFEEQTKLLSKYNIRGEKIGVFFYHMCTEDWIKFELSLYMLEFEYYTKEELHDNMNSNFPLPLVYEKYKGQEEEELFKYFDNQRDLFDKRKENRSSRIRLIMNR